MRFTYTGLPLPVVLAIIAALANAEYYNVTLDAEHEALRLLPQERWRALTGARWRKDRSMAGMRYSGEAEARVEFDFIGTALYWSTFRGPDRGYLRLTIDDSPHAVVDDYSKEADTLPTISWRRTGLAHGPHHVVISNMLDDRIGRYPAIVLNAVHYTRAENKTLPPPSAAAAAPLPGHMNLGVTLGVTIGAVSLLVAFIIWQVLKRRRRSRLAPSHLWRETTNQTTGPSRWRKWSIAWPQGLHLPRSRSAHREVTPYQLPPLPSPPRPPARTQSSSTQLDSQLESTDSPSPARTPIAFSPTTTMLTPVTTTPLESAGPVLSPIRSPSSSTNRGTILSVSSIPHSPIRSPSSSSNPPRRSTLPTPATNNPSPASAVRTPSSGSQPSRRTLLSPQSASSFMSVFQFPPRFSRSSVKADSTSHITPFQLPPLPVSPAASNTSYTAPQRTPSQISSQPQQQQQQQYPPVRRDPDAKYGLHPISSVPHSPQDPKIPFTPVPPPPPIATTSAPFVIVGGPAPSTTLPEDPGAPSPMYYPDPSSSFPSTSKAPLVLTPPAPAATRPQLPRLVVDPEPEPEPEDEGKPSSRGGEPRPRGRRNPKEPPAPAFRPRRQKTPPPPYQGPQQG